MSKMYNIFFSIFFFLFEDRHLSSYVFFYPEAWHFASMPPV
jgi:hypothetical protein